MNQVFYCWVSLFIVLVWMPLIMVGQTDLSDKNDLETLPTWQSRGQIQFRVPVPQPDTVEILEEVHEDPVQAPRDSIPSPMEFVLLEQEPRCLNIDSVKMVIGYPPIAKEKEIEGKVILRVLVDRRGMYSRHVIIKDPNPILMEAVQRNIPYLRFSPAMSHHEPVWGWVTISFDFRSLK